MAICQRTAVILVQVVVGAGSLAGQTIRTRDAAGQERVCQSAQIPKDLPPVDAVLDAAALRTRIGGLAAGTDSATYLLSLLFAERGAAATVRLLEPAVNSSPLPEAVRATVRRQQRPGPWGLRLRVTAGPPLALTVERSVYCPPASATVSGEEGSRAGTPYVRPGDRLPRPSEQRNLEARLTLSEAGTVLQVKLTSRSGIKELDDWFVSGLQSARYLPALFDGLPIPSWYRTDGTRLRL